MATADASKVVLILDMDEAQVVSDLCANVGGDYGKTRRIADHLYDVLRNAGTLEANVLYDRWPFVSDSWVRVKEGM